MIWHGIILLLSSKFSFLINILSKYLRKPQYSGISLDGLHNCIGTLRKERKEKHGTNKRSWQTKVSQSGLLRQFTQMWLFLIFSALFTSWCVFKLFITSWVDDNFHIQQNHSFIALEERCNFSHRKLVSKLHSYSHNIELNSLVISRHKETIQKNWVHGPAQLLLSHEITGKLLNWCVLVYNLN